MGYPSGMSPNEDRVNAEIKQMVDAIYCDKVLRAREENPIAKLLDGFVLFESGLEITKLDVIRKLRKSDESSVQEALRLRFERVRRMHEAGVYKPL